jgi:uncharacterized membrane protein
MTQLLTALCIWLHALATVVFIGYYLLLSGVCIPVLAQENGAILSRISKRSRPWLYSSLLVFILTGIYLMVIDPGYLGFADFGNAWGILMLVKHILVLVMIAAGFWFNAILRVGPMMVSNRGAEGAIRRFRSHANLMSILGVLILLLTALAQVQ